MNYAICGINCHMHNNLIYHVLRRLLSYNIDQQPPHKCQPYDTWCSKCAY